MVQARVCKTLYSGSIPLAASSITAGQRPFLELPEGVIAFFGYVLEILVEIYEQVFNTYHELAEEADER